MKPYILPGTFTGLIPAEVELFQKLLPKLEEEVFGPLWGVEIGCLDGWSTAHILGATQRLRLTSIDPFVPDSMEPSLKGNPFRVMANTLPFRGRFRVILDYAENVVRTWRQPLDFLFIDGDHRPAEVRRDYALWTPFIRTGGLLAMHDCRMGRENGAPYHPGPSQAAAEEVFGKPKEWEVLGEAWSLMIARKISR